MKMVFMAAAALSAAASCHAVALAAELPVRVILVGDSTMQTNSGYGDALCARFRAGVDCINLAKGGRSTSSFRAEGRWDTVMNLLRERGKFRATYVLVQFGHNDQPGKPGRSTDLVTEFPANMARYAREVHAAGGIPVLLTPLTRRSFQDGVLENNLAPWAAATRKVAADTASVMLDLNADSYAIVQAMGQQEADTLAMVPPPTPTTTAMPAAASAAAPASTQAERAGDAKSAFDRTHLGEKGARLFSGIVQRELSQAIPALAGEFKEPTR